MVIELLGRLKESKFYGEVLVKMEAGKVVIIKKTENIKP